MIANAFGAALRALRIVPAKLEVGGIFCLW